MTGALVILSLMVASVEGRGTEVCRTPGFRMLSEFASGEAGRSILAARRWLAAHGQHADKLFVAVGATDGCDELGVIDEIECVAETHRGCAGEFCATLVVDSDRDEIGSATFWR